MDLSRSNNILSLGFLLLLCTFITSAYGDDLYTNANDDEALQALAVDESYDEDAETAYKDAKVEPKPFDRKVWNEKKKGLNYTKNIKPEEEEKKKDKPDSNKTIEHQGSDREYTLNFGPIGQLLLVVLVIGVLALIVFILVKTGFLEGNTKIAQDSQGPVLLDQIEDNLHESDLERALRLALEAKDYRMAIRVYYLTVIKELSLRDWIKWKRDKTNGQYVREMMDKPEGTTFRQLTNAFEHTWYSDEEIVLKHYEVLSPQFQSFIGSLKKR